MPISRRRHRFAVLVVGPLIGLGLGVGPTSAQVAGRAPGPASGLPSAWVGSPPPAPAP
jgi:hypothetical protein